jgi:branched-subunit amino acid aminotransferase/4-amino-4-deoxychorismate lyase
MDEVQLFAVTKAGAQQLVTPPQVSSFEDLYNGLSPGVYSALRTFSHNKFLYLEAHIARTRRSIELMGWDWQFDEGDLRQALHQVCTAYPLSDARVRFDVLAEPATSFGTDSRVLIALLPMRTLPDHFYQQGVAVGLAPGFSRQHPQVKTAAFALTRREFVRSHKEASPYEFLILDEEGYILEGMGSNFYGVRNGVVYTAAHGMLEGISRQIILELLPQMGIPLCLRAIHRDEIDTLDEAGMSSSSRALVPIVAIAGQVIGRGQPGPICQRILTVYNQFVAERVKLAVDW